MVIDLGCDLTPDTSRRPPQQVRGLSPIAAGFSFLPLAITLILAMIVVPRIIRRFELTRTAILGMAATILGIG